LFVCCSHICFIMVRVANVVVALPALVSARLNEGTTLPTCPPADFSTVENFDLDAFVSRRWWIHQQQAVTYLPVEQNRCVYAEYTKFTRPTLFGYDIRVDNHAEEVVPPHTVHDTGSGICAKIVDGAAGKLAVAPCFLPIAAAGPYWVIDVNEEEGYALISGGLPTVPASGGCQMDSGTVNDSGLWIFTREAARDEALVQKVRGIAAQKGFDLSILNDIDNSDCSDSVTV